MPCTRRHCRLRFGSASGPGFALVATMAMMALVVMLTLALLSLATEATRARSSVRHRLEAESNARLALRLALADLQRQMGPDGRVSAPGDLTDDPAKTTPEHARWTGVYDSWEASKGLLQRPSPVFRRWLVSGDRVKLVDRGGVIVVQPEEVEMMTPPDSSKPGEGRVRVPVMKTGAGGPAGASGQLAWWVADESMKANVRGAGAWGGEGRPESEALLGAGAALRADASLGLGVEKIDGIEALRGKMVNTGVLQHLAPQARARAHDMTVHSLGLMVDVTRRRLRYDFSQLAALPRTAVAGIPLYDASGRINDISFANGRPHNNALLQTAAADPIKNFGTARQPGINLEELWIHANLYRNLRWDGSTPTLVAMAGAEATDAADFRVAACSDPSILYWKPIFTAVQFIFSFTAEPSTTAPGKYDMKVNMDSLVSVWNPNNVRLEIPPPASFCVQLLSLPFKVQWFITDATGTAKTLPAQSGLGANTYGLNKGSWSSSGNTYGQGTFAWFRANIGGLAMNGSPKGYTLEPGECAIFGYADKVYMDKLQNVDLARGWGPERSALMAANLGANGLDPTDRISFTVTPDDGCLPSGSSRTYINKWIGFRSHLSDNGGLAFGGSTLQKGIDFTNPDPVYFPAITASQVLRVSDYANGQRKPFLLFGHLLNVEQSAGGTKDSFPSQARLMDNPVVQSRLFSTTDPARLHVTQEIWRADPLPLSYDSPLININAKDRGYFGGGHTITDGVNQAALRALSVTPPVSLMALSQAPANGFSDRYAQAQERRDSGLDGLESILTSIDDSVVKFPPSAIAFSAQTYLPPQVTRAIGGGHMHPALPPDSVIGPNGAWFSHRSSSGPLVDHAYLANVSLFDSWFCSSVFDGALVPKGAPYADSRGITKRLKDFFQNQDREEKNRLPNPQFVPISTWEEAASDVGEGSKPVPEAIVRLAAHLAVQGAFNVNSTRKEAWKGFLASARGQLRVFPEGTKAEGTTPCGVSGLSAAGAAKPSSNPDELEQWSGYRILTDDQIDKLAERMVREVKARGPFLSVADFLNRRPGATDPRQQALGAMQAAIEAADLNAPLVASGRRNITPADFPGYAGASSTNFFPARSAGIPGYLLQADVLAPMANQLTPRGDTFTIRVCGRATDPNGRTLSEAWAEAVVQRLPGYIDPVDPAHVPGDALQSPINRTFGRRFQVLSFRWLSREEV